MKKFFSLLLLVLTSVLSGQSLQDVSRFSQGGYLGSARYLATGGAFTSLGNDFAAVHQNPAGLGVFRRSEFSITLGNDHVSSNTNSAFQNRNLTTDRNIFNLGNIGFVTKFKDDHSNWGGSFGISFTRMADYNNNVLVENKNMNSSRIESWINNANGTPPQDLAYNGLLHERMAWEQFLIDEGNNNSYSSQAKWNNVNQDWAVEQKGSMNELSIAFAADKDNKLFLGGSLNVPFVTFTENKTYRETGFDGDSISSFSMKEYNKITGAGFNIKLGAIYEFEHNIRIGAAIHTPTWFQLTQNWEDQILGVYTHAGPKDTASSFYSDPYKWRLTTPWRFSVGVSKIFNKTGFLSVDYEFNTLNSAVAKADSFSIKYLNDDLNNYTQNYHTIKIGGELRLNRVYIRGGYNFQTSGLTKSENYETIRMISAGIGYRGKTASIEFAYAIRTYQQDVYIYNPDITNHVQYSVRPLMFTFSYRFGN